MAVRAAEVANADRMMVRVTASPAGLNVVFADGASGVMPLSEIPEIGKLEALDSMELPDPYELHLKTTRGETVELPWNFVRHYCDSAYRERVELVSSKGRQSIGNRLRALREARALTQEQMAEAAGIGRITLVRIEAGQRSPRYDTLIKLAKALDTQPAELLP